MSNPNPNATPASLGQAKQTLNLIGQQEPSNEDMDILHSGYLTDMVRAIKQGVIPPRDQLHAMLGLGPLFKTDKYGRVLVTVTGLGLISAEWPAHLDALGLKLTDRALDILSHTVYDEKHRLEAGKSYTVALMFGEKEFATDAERTITNLRARGERDYGKSDDLRGELALLIRKAISDKQMEHWGIRCITVPHEPIVSSWGDGEAIFASSFVNGGRKVFTYNELCNNWPDHRARTAVAVPVSV